MSIHTESSINTVAISQYHIDATAVVMQKIQYSV